MDHTFDGQLKWTVEPQCFETDIHAAELEREMLATRTEWTAKEKEMVSQLSILLSCTTSVEIVGTKKPATAVVKMTEMINNRPPADELVAWRFKLPYKLRDAWHSAWNEGQDLFSVDPAQLPSSELTEAQKADPFLQKPA